MQANTTLTGGSIDRWPISKPAIRIQLPMRGAPDRQGRGNRHQPIEPRTSPKPIATPRQLLVQRQNTGCSTALHMHRKVLGLCACESCFPIHPMSLRIYVRRTVVAAIARLGFLGALFTHEVSARGALKLGGGTQRRLSLGPGSWSSKHHLRNGWVAMNGDSPTPKTPPSTAARRENF